MNRETKLDIIEMTRGYVGAILLMVLMWTGVVSAMFAGESMTFKTDLTEPIYWNVVGNSSDMEGLNVSFDNGNITITTQIDFKPDNFTIIFFNEITNNVETIVYSGGGGSTKYVDKIINKTETIYLPEYINDTKIIEVEKIIDNITVLETGYELWHILLGMILGIAFGWFVIGKKDD